MLDKVLSRVFVRGARRVKTAGVMALCVMVVVALWAVAPASAQSSPGIDSAGIRPDRAYYGFRRSMPMTVDLGMPVGDGAAPMEREGPGGPVEGASGTGNGGGGGGGVNGGPAINTDAAIDSAQIVLYESMTTAALGGGAGQAWREVTRSGLKAMWADPAVRGNLGAALVKVDFGEMFPALWTVDDPRVMIAQLEISGVPRGSPLVIQPLMTPVYAARTDRTGMPIFVEPEERRRSYSGVRVWTAKSVVVETTLGTMEFALYPEQSPNTVRHFMELVSSGFYTEILVHRVASLRGRAEPDIVQAGDPLGNGLGGPGFSIDLEPSKLEHDFGVLSMARAGDPNSNGSQFFICLNREGTRTLDGQYTSFGRLIRGQDVLLAIAKVPVGADERPLSPPVIRRMWLADAPAKGSEAPPVQDPFAGGGGR